MNIFVNKYLNIFEYPNICYTLYRDSSYPWSMAKSDGEGIMTYLVPGEEWGVLRGIDHLLDLRELSMKMPSSKQQVHVLGLSCSFCNDGTVKLFEEEVQYLVDKLPFACQQEGLVSLIQPSSAEEGKLLAPGQGFQRSQTLSTGRSEHRRGVDVNGGEV